MKRLTLVGILAIMLAVSGALALEPTRDPQAAAGGWAGSETACPTPGGGDASIIINPSAACQFVESGQGHQFDLELFIRCVELGIDGHPEYQAQRTDLQGPIEKIEFAFNRADGDDLPDVRLREDDPNLQVSYLSLQQGSPTTARIGGFEEHPSSPGGVVKLWINDESSPAAQVASGNYPDANALTQALYDDLIANGFDADLDTSGFPAEIQVSEDPFGATITFVKLQVDDPALVTSDIQLITRARVPTF